MTIFLVVAGLERQLGGETVMAARDRAEAQ